jgi:ankyrin repeat protein
MYSMGADMNFVVSFKKGVSGWFKELSDPPNLFQEPIWKVRVESLVFTLLSPMLIPCLAISKRVCTWWHDLRTPPIIRLLESWECETDLDALRQLIAEGADVNARREKGQETPLLMAARRGWIEVCRLLCAAGADPNSQRHDGWVALYSADLYRHVPLLIVLLEAGADPNALASTGSQEIRNGIDEWKAKRVVQNLEVKLSGTHLLSNKRRL